MDPRQNHGRQHDNGRQHQRFSWQIPPDTSPEEATQAQQSQQTAQQTHAARLNTNVDAQHNRGFSYAQTPSEHLAFQYIPSPSDPVPPLPQVHQSPPTPIDPRPQSIYTPHNHVALPQATPHPSHTSHAYEEKPPVSPLSPHYAAKVPRSPVSPTSPVSQPPQVYTQAPNQHAQHARNFSSLSPINTNIAVYNMPPIPPTPSSHYTPASSIPSKTPITPLTPNSLKKDSAELLPGPSPNSRASYAHAPYSPHNLTAPTSPHHTVFSPDAAHGPNGLDFALHQPGQVAHPNMDLSPSGATHPWNTSLCSCTSDVSTCLTGLFAPCILYGRTAYRLSQKSSKNDPTDLLSHKKVNANCVLMAASCALWCVFPAVQRVRVRRLYKLEGSVAGDCARGCCCCWCVACQNEREVKGREEEKSRCAGPAQAYKSMSQMKYAPQQ